MRYFAEKRGSRRLEAFNEINARVEWKPPVGKSGRFGVIMDVFNVLNNSQVQEVQDRDNGFFNEPREHNIGRKFRFGLRYEF